MNLLYSRCVDHKRLSKLHDAWLKLSSAGKNSFVSTCEQQQSSIPCEAQSKPASINNQAVAGLQFKVYVGASCCRCAGGGVINEAATASISLPVHSFGRAQSTDYGNSPPVSENDVQYRATLVTHLQKYPHKCGWARDVDAVILTLSHVRSGRGGGVLIPPLP